VERWKVIWWRGGGVEGPGGGVWHRKVAVWWVWLYYLLFSLTTDNVSSPQEKEELHLGL
jgi:hypothetical protein